MSPVLAVGLVPRPPHPPGEGVCGVLNEFSCHTLDQKSFVTGDTVKINQTNNNSLIELNVIAVLRG